MSIKIKIAGEEVTVKCAHWEDLGNGRWRYSLSGCMWEGKALDGPDAQNKGWALFSKGGFKPGDYSPVK